MTPNEQMLLEALESLIGEADLGEIDHSDEVREKLERARATIVRITKGEPPPLRPDFLTLDNPGERDVTLVDGIPFWLAVNGVNVWVRPTAGGVRVELYRQETEAPLDVATGGA